MPKLFKKNAIQIKEIHSRLIGGVLLIIGTSIGGGMLALPVVTAAAGFTHSLFFLVFCWLVMTVGALLMLEVNLQLPPGSNLISMAKSTLGMPGQMVTWITYLFLLYTLLAAYISGGSDVLNGLLLKLHIHAPLWVTCCLFTGGFGILIYHGIRTVDYTNRLLMFGKLGSFILLVLMISPRIQVSTWHNGSLPAITSSLMVLITSFGFASIIPSLREYFKNDIASLRKVILLGSLIPLLCYIVWDAVIMGVIPREGNHGLIALANSIHATSGLIDALNNTGQQGVIIRLFSFFASICMVTAFLGVSLGLFDFLADGLRRKKVGTDGISVFTLTFLPPLAIVLISPGVYLNALRYAGKCCVILLLLLPAIMAWQTRRTTPVGSIPLVPGGKLSLFCIGMIACGLLIISTYY